MNHYRYQGKVIYDEFSPPSVNIEFIEYESVKETKYGYWIIEKSLLPYYKQKLTWVKPRFVLKQSKKRYAYPTKEEALNSLKARNKKRIAYLKRDLNNAECIFRKIK